MRTTEGYLKGSIKLEADNSKVLTFVSRAHAMKREIEIEPTIRQVLSVRKNKDIQQKNDNSGMMGNQNTGDARRCTLTMLIETR